MDIAKNCLQTPLAGVKSPLKLKWKQGKDMPVDMANHVQAVVIGDNVYVGGGVSSKNASTVMVYGVHTGSWSTLPRYESHWFGMAAVNDYNQLVLVGGISTNIFTDPGKATNVLGMWDEGSRIWTHPFPKMPTARYLLSVVSYQKWLAVAGGKDEKRSESNKVELLDTLSGQWYEGSPLPSGYSEMSSAINGNMWYLLGGFSLERSTMHVLSVCLDELISQAASQSIGTTSPSTSSPWHILTDTPLTNSTILVLKGALLAVGGYISSAIHLYQPSSRSWVKVSDLPTEQWQCACTVLPSGEIFVAGGGLERERVDIGTIAV